MPESRQLTEALLREPASPGARVGITGPPGAGKSTIVSGLARGLRSRGVSVGVLAIDPTSPYSGGALLGDRIRMGELATDPGIFFRSMASRGALGGLGSAAGDVLELMDAFGFDWLLAEPVGAGQVETEIADAADTVVVVLVPESGDDVQTLKAGMLEVADLLVVNKADREGAELVASDLRAMLELRDQSVSPEGGTPPSAWLPPVILTEGRTGEGVGSVLEEIDRHRDHLEASGELVRRRRRSVVARVKDLLRRELDNHVERLLQGDGWGEGVMDRVVEDRATPHQVVQKLLRQTGVEG